MARKKVVPEYGTIMKRGVQYYRTRMQDADGKWISLYAQTPEELYDKSIEMKRSIEDEIFRMRFGVFSGGHCGVIGMAAKTFIDIGHQKVIRF